MKTLAKNDKIIKSVLSKTHKFYKYLGLGSVNIDDKISPVSKFWKTYSLGLIIFTVVLEISFYMGLTQDRMYFASIALLKYLVSVLLYSTIFCGSISSWIISAFFSERKLRKMVVNFESVERKVKSKMDKTICKVFMIHAIFIVVFVAHFVYGSIWITRNPLFYWVYVRVFVLNMMIIKFVAESIISCFFLQDLIDVVSDGLKQNGICENPKFKSKLDLASIFDSYSKICCNIQISRKLIIWPVSIF